MSDSEQGTNGHHAYTNVYHSNKEMLEALNTARKYLRRKRNICEDCRQALEAAVRAATTLEYWLHSERFYKKVEAQKIGRRTRPQWAAVGRAVFMSANKAFTCNTHDDAADAVREHNKPLI